jgi:RTX calcium-binding nonapeptide repeat (4 copies)
MQPAEGGIAAQKKPKQEGRWERLQGEIEKIEEITFEGPDGVRPNATLADDAAKARGRLRKGRGMKRTLLSFMVVVATVMLAATAAIAATITCSGGICNGTPERDEITGSTSQDSINAMGSVDIVSANKGADWVQLGGGGTPKDMEFVEGGSGSDELHGGAGSDELDDFTPAAIDDTDLLFGGDNDDFLYAVDGDSNDTLSGGPGADDCYGDPGDKIVDCEGENNP